MNAKKCLAVMQQEIKNISFEQMIQSTNMFKSKFIKDLKYVNEMILWFSPNAITANLWRTINITHIETLSEQWTGSRKWQRGQEQKEQAIKGWQKEWN